MGYHGVAQIESGRADQQILKGDGDPLGLLFGVNAASLARQLSRDGIDGNVGNKVFQKLPAADGSRGFPGSPDSVLQFHHADYGKRNCLGAGDFADRGQ